MRKVNILLVDDQPGNLLSYQSILDGLGENLVTARSGREALQCLLREDFSVILLDVMMPDMNGFETATLIRQHPRLEHTPIIYLSAFTTSDLARLKGYELGAVDFVFAPVVPEILRAKVSVFVELHRKRWELAEANANLLVEISERQRAEEQALQANRLAAIGEMAAGLAHESRNALQQIQASLEMLTRRLPDRDAPELIGEIQKAHDRLYNLFEQIRGYAAPITPDRKHCDLAQIWREALQQLTSVRPEREIQVREQVSAALTCKVDPFSMEQVFRNVLENSLAACLDPVVIEICCAEARMGERAGINILIRDNGPGLTPEQRQNIFVPFYTTKNRGSGLGMAIAQRIVLAHGGLIAAENGTERGTSISIQIPRGIP